VESTTVRSVGYQRRSRILEIEFQSGAVYQYVDVPARVYEEFWKAESKGKYFNCEIRDAYAFVCMQRGRAAGGKQAAMG
jgi:predicted nucleic acid-binding protein